MTGIDDDALDGNSESDSQISESMRNLVDNIKYESQLNGNSGFNLDKYNSNTKKRWWTPEEDEQLKQLVD